MANFYPGAVLNDRFIIISSLGSGSFGLTLHCYDLKTNANVALKILRNAAPSESEMIEFRTEHCIAKLIHSPYVVKTYGYSEASGANAVDAIIFQFSYSETLETFCSGVHTSGHNIIDQFFLITMAFAQATSGLASVHGQNLLHRDIKGDNIIVDYLGRSRLIDFGLIIAMQGPDKKEPSGALVYRSPEVYENGASVHTDIYSMGFLFFEMLAQQKPLYQLPISLDCCLDFNFPNLPKPIAKAAERVFLKAVSLDASTRYQSATEMANDLWSIIAEVNSIRFNVSHQDTLPAIAGGYVKDIEVLINYLERIDQSNSGGLRDRFYRLDGIFLIPEEKYSIPNATEAFSFKYEGTLYQINADSSRRSIARLLDSARVARKHGTDFSKLLKAVRLPNDDRALRLTSFVPNQDNIIPANGFYCYAVEDLEKISLKKFSGDE